MAPFYLVIYIYAGAFASSDAAATLTAVPQPSLQACQQAGEQLASLVKTSTKNLRFACIKGQ